MEYVDVICDHCKHFNPFEKSGCDAFEDIPDVILSGENKHDKPLPGQKNNIVFEKREDDNK